MDLSRLRDLPRRLANYRVLVLGDLMMDEYIWGQVSRISPEAPVMVVDAQKYTQVPGGAANVVNNMCALGAGAIVLGVVGDDESGRNLTAALRNEGADVEGLVVAPDRPTTRKTRIVAHSQQVVRVDHESREPISTEAKNALVAMLTTRIAEADAVLLSDYQKGVLSRDIVSFCAVTAHKFKKPIVGNLKPILLKQHCPLTVITLNLLEAAEAAGSAALADDSAILAAGKKILETTGAENILITQGSHGMSLFSRSNPDAPTHIPARPVEVYDVAGAGDTVASTMTLALAAGATPADAVALANFAASEVVKKLGVSTVSAAEIEHSIDAAV